MQPQPQPISAEERQYALTSGESAQNIDPISEHYQAQESPGTKKKSMMGKVKDKAKKFKTKLKSPKLRNSGDGSSSSSSEEEGESDQSPQSVDTPILQSDLPDQNKDREMTDECGSKDEKITPPYEDVPAADAVQKRFGELNLDSQSPEKPQDNVPTSADASVEEGRVDQGRDFTTEQSKIAGAAGTLGVESASAEHDHGAQSEEKKSMLQQARETIFGSQPGTHEAQPEGEEQPKPTLTSRAAETVFGLKDTLTSKLGYGDSSPTPESETITTRAANTVLGLKDTVATKFGYGAGSSPTGVQSEDNPEENTPASKSYAQRAQEMVIGGKDVVLTKIGYGSAPGDGGSVPGDGGTDQQQKTYLQKMQETAYGAKDAVAAKLGYNAEQTEASEHEKYGTPSRFHPGEEEKALSVMITDAMSNSAATVKSTVLSSFGSSKNTSAPQSSPSPPPPSAPSDTAT